MKNLFYLIIVLIGFSCKGSLSDREELKSVHLGVINATPKQEKVVLEDLNATIKSIRLETNDSCILNKITQLVDVDYLWIVADRQLYKFDKSGAFIGLIGQKGQGPAEYVAPERIQVDREQKIVYVIDYLGRKMMSFDYEGNFLRSLPLPEDYSLNRIALDNKQLYYSSYTNSVMPDLFACDMTTGKIDTISFRERTMGQEAYAGETFMYHLNGKAYLYHYFNDTVYTLADNRLTPAYLFDLGDSKFSFKQLTVTGEATSEEPIDHPKIQLSNFIDTEKYIILSYSVVNSWRMGTKPDQRFALYDKVEQVMYPDVYLVSEKQDIFSLEPEDPIFASTDEHSIFTFKQASDLLEDHEIEGLDVEDNPVIVQYTFN